MKLSTKKTLAILSLFAIFTVLLVQVPTAHSEVVSTSIAQNKALTFIEDVIQPDMSKYKVTLVNDVVGQAPNQPSETQESVHYYLGGTNGNGLDILCVFTNNILTFAQLTTNGSSTFYSNLSTTNATAEALATLEGYQTYTDENLQDMTNALTSVDATQNLTKTSGDIQLTVQNTPPYVAIYLKSIYNGTVYTGVQFSFQNGQFYTFMDDRSLYTIGNTDVNINETQAVNIAQQYAQNYSYSTSNGTVVQGGFNVTRVNAGLSFYSIDNSTTIEPYWSVQLYLGQFYPGSVYALSFGIWAGSGTLFLAQPIALGGGSLPAAPNASTSQQTQSHGQTGISTLDVAIATGTIVAIALISAIVVKKRSK
jgi:hypothetical protein